MGEKAKTVSDHDVTIDGDRSPTYVRNCLDDIARRTVSKVKDDMLTNGLPGTYRVLIERACSDDD